MSDFVIYDVFTDQRFGGNPLAVVLNAQELAEEDLQRIAREFNFSETTFVYPPENPDHTAKVRIFTPTMEIPFAGHPTIGTATALRDKGHDGDMTLELGVGPLPCTFDGQRAAFTTTTPLTRTGTPDVNLVARALGVGTKDIKTDTHPPVQAGVGLPFVMVELSDSAVLGSCTPSLTAIREGVKHHPVGHDFSIFAYVRRGSQVNARMFAPLNNIPEDPATGSASATLAALLTDLTGQEQALTIQQGVEMGRPSIIHATSRIESTIEITIAGNAVKVMEGRLV